MRFRILGPLEVQVDGSWSGISAPKWRTVLAVLLLRVGEVVSTDQLINELWPEEPAGPGHQPGQRVRAPAAQADRRRRGQVLVTRSPGYQLLVPADDIDAGRFARLAAEGRQALSAGEGPSGRPAARRGSRAVAGRPGAG